LLAAQDFVSINHLIVAVIDAIAEVHDSVEDGSATLASTDTAETVGVHSERLGRLVEWAFAALAFVDTPLIDEIQYQLQRLRRTCQKLILAEQPGDGSSGSVAGDSSFRAKANLLVVIVTKVFGQW